VLVARIAVESVRHLIARRASTDHRPTLGVSCGTSFNGANDTLSIAWWFLILLILVILAAAGSRAARK